MIMSDRAGLEESILRAVDPLVVMRRVVDEALAAVPSADGAVVELLAAGVLSCACAGGTLAEVVGTRLTLDGSLSGLAVRTATTLRCDDTRLDNRVDTQACLRVGAGSMVCVPLQRWTEIVGVLNLCAARPCAFGEDTVALLNGLATFISDAIGGWTDLAASAAAVLSGAAPANSTQQPPGQPTAGTPQAGSRHERASRFVANVLHPGALEDRAARQRIEAVLSGSGPIIDLQPIIDLKTALVAGCEALARFTAQPRRSPDRWFAEADTVGLGAELQLAAVRAALAALPDVPEALYMVVNVGPDIAGHTDLLRLLNTVDARRIVIELTEHSAVEDYPALMEAIGRIRATGARLAIDDTGAGFAGFSHILKLAPDLIKLDRTLTTGIDTDPARQALAGALVNFASATHAEVVAEGIEAQPELDMIHRLGIQYGQGYFLGRPAPASALAAMPGLRAARRPGPTPPTRVRPAGPPD